MPIEFENARRYLSAEESVFFQARVNHLNLRCLISREALEDHFGAHGGAAETRSEGCLRAFDENREEIYDAARRMINALGEDLDGARAIVVSTHFL